MSDQPTSSGFSWTEVVSRGLKLRVPSPTSRNKTADGQRVHYTHLTIFENPDVFSLLRANQVESIVTSVLAPESVIFSIPCHLFADDFDAFALIRDKIGPVVGDYFYLHSSARANKDLVLSTKFRSDIHTRLALNEGVTVKGMQYKGTPYKDKVAANHLIRINLSLSVAEEDDILVEKLQRSLGHYGRVVQIKKLMRRGFAWEICRLH